ncbi:hypothetical protein LCGC14_1422910 [marine sediment metagenome]|uniref:Uncharacterized protein n=1 Tax=marine sediment metagenome TaxID=412755 RepID=A0A0F9JQL5_9ZZZZ
MKTVQPENKKYVNKFGMTKSSSVDWHRESLKPRARCSFCVEQYGDAPKHDHLTLEVVCGVSYLCCTRHRGRRRG